MYQVLYRKWRPRRFEDVAGQPHVTNTLRSELRAGRLAHAYLFTGSRGTGKTTCAKILAKAVNCLRPIDGDPCNECEMCRGIDDGSILDVIEIDAASNNGVDNIRDLREEANFTPASAKFRVYIIDEVHMLSVGAFNALLKTLEEPPPHVKFILATTEVHKLPATILSRCQRFDFRRIPPEDIAARLAYVAGEEKIELAHEAALLIARLADGALRDALSLLDQCAGRGGRITQETVGAVAGLTGRDYLFELSGAMQREDTASALEALDMLHNGSCDMERLCAELIGHFRSFMMIKTMKQPEQLIVCTQQELQRSKEEAQRFSLEAVLYALDLLQDTLERMRRGTDRRIEMEMALVKLCTPRLATDEKALLRRIAALEAAVRAGASGQTAAPPVNPPVQAPQKPVVQHSPPEQAPPDPVAKKARQPADDGDTPPLPEPPPDFAQTARAQRTSPEPEPAPPQEEPDPAAGDIPFLQWPEALEELSHLDKPIKGVLVGSSAYLHGEFVLIKSENPILDQFIRQSTHASAVREAIARVTGRKYRLGICKKAPTVQAQAQKDPLNDLIGRIKDSGIPFEEQ